MSAEENTVLGNKFFVILSGKTNGAHQFVVKHLRDYGQTEVDSSEASDYLLVFCPVASRVGTDIHEALSKISDVKKAILVVMHHTFNPDHIIADSRSLVQKQNILITVDCLFYEGDLLRCNRNSNSMTDIERVLGVPNPWVAVKAAGWKNTIKRFKIHLIFSFIVIVIALLIIICIILV